MFQKVKAIGLHIFIIGLISLIVSIPYFGQLNNLILDKLQGSISPREDILIVEINDESLGEIGAWPWSRDVFANALYELDKGNPKVVAFDILFLEERESDSQFTQAIDEVSFPIVLGSKIFEGELYESIFVTEMATSGYTNFVPDADSKIRTTTIATELNDTCVPSFAFATLQSYLGIRNIKDCDGTVSLSSKLSYSTDLQFIYPKDEFSSISFADLYSGNVAPDALNGKIVLIGSTVTDLKSGLLDNFIDVFGQSRPGVSIHASIINSFLENRFQEDLNSTQFLIGIVLFSTVLFVLYQILKRTLLEAVLFGITLIGVNIVALVAYEYEVNWPILQSNIIIVAGYVYFIAFKYLVTSREKRFITQAFGKYINPALLNELISKPDMLKLGGEQKEITVLFSDIQGYTGVAEKLSPTELVEYTNSYFDIETEVIIKNNGTIDKYIGDSIMAFWNAPVNDPNHKLNAVKAALEMQNALKDFNTQHPNLPDISCGIGVNSDTMIVGNMGSKKRFNYTLIGDGVNLGARIEGLTRMYNVGIIATENVIKNIKTNNESFLFRKLDIVTVKGKEKAVTIYEVLKKDNNNEKVKDTYEKAFEHYQKGDFAKATKLLKTLKDDAPSQVLLKRIPKIQNKKDWNGIWKWESK